MRVDISTLTKHVEAGLSSHRIAESEKVSQTTVRYWLRKHGLQTKPNRKWSLKRKRGLPPLSRIDWLAVQAFHDGGGTWKEICQRFEISIVALTQAKTRGLFVSRSGAEARRLAHSSGKVDYAVYRTPQFRDGQRHLGGYRARSGTGKGAWTTNLKGESFYLQSSYEVRMAAVLAELGIQWERPDSFSYTLDDETHRYYPDFLLTDYGIYIDTKNDYLIRKDAHKIEAVREQNAIRLVVVENEQISREYVQSMLILR